MTHTEGEFEFATIVLTSSSWVVDRGEAKEWWEIERDGQWIVAWKHPSAGGVGPTQDSQTLGPGQIWCCTTELRLPVGTRLKRARTSPRGVAYRDAMDFIQRAKRDKDRNVVVNFFRLAGEHRKVEERSQSSSVIFCPKPSAGDATRLTDRRERARLERARQQAQVALAEFERTLSTENGPSSEPLAKHRRAPSRARVMTLAQAKREADRQVAALLRWEREQAG